MINFQVYKNGKLLVQDSEEFSVDINKNQILFILHGLFGRGKNWQSFAKKFSSDKDQIVITVDLRNHGGNDFKNEHSYLSMAYDIVELAEYLKIQKIDLLGHSMGGKVAMVLALSYQHLINKLVVADIAPINYPEDNQIIIDILLSLETNLIKNRNHADEILSKYINEKFLRAFLLQNLELVDGIYDWSINLKVIKNSMRELRSFPNFNNKSAVDNKLLCIYGENSDYVKNQYFDVFKEYFNNTYFQKINNAGHFLHVEKPDEFYEISRKFLRNKTYHVV